MISLQFKANTHEIMFREYQAFFFLPKPLLSSALGSLCILLFCSLQATLFWVLCLLFSCFNGVIKIYLLAIGAFHKHR